MRGRKVASLSHARTRHGKSGTDEIWVSSVPGYPSPDIPDIDGISSAIQLPVGPGTPPPPDWTIIDIKWQVIECTPFDQSVTLGP